VIFLLCFLPGTVIMASLHTHKDNKMKTATLNGISNPELFRSLLHILRERFEYIPEQGLLAGQAIASACYQYLKVHSNAPMRDLDVFMTSETLPKHRIAQFDDSVQRVDDQGRKIVSEHAAARMVRQFGQPDTSIEAVSHGSANFFEDSDGITSGAYTIIGSYIDREHADVNYISVRTHSTANTAMAILQGFDINACQIGIDIEREIVYWTPEFERFLDDKTLRITFFGTPMHSAVRLCKKADDLPFAQVDFDKECRALATMRAIIANVEAERAKRAGKTIGLPGQLFSEIYAKRFAQYEAQLAPYFELTPRALNITHHYTAVNAEGQQEHIEAERDLDFFVLTARQHDADTPLYAIINLMITQNALTETSNLEFMIRTFGQIEAAKSSTVARRRIEALPRYFPEGIRSLPSVALFASLMQSLQVSYYPSVEDFHAALAGYEGGTFRLLASHNIGHGALRSQLRVGQNVHQIQTHNLYTLKPILRSYGILPGFAKAPLTLEPTAFLVKARAWHEQELTALRQLTHPRQMDNILALLSETLKAQCTELTSGAALFDAMTSIDSDSNAEHASSGLFDRYLFVHVKTPDEQWVLSITRKPINQRHQVDMLVSSSYTAYRDSLELLSGMVNLQVKMAEKEVTASPFGGDLHAFILPENEGEGVPSIDFLDEIPF
jgi:hypothetical protein